MSTYRYGDHPSQVCELHLPDQTSDDGPRGVVVLVHGGFWRARYDRSLQVPVACDLTAHGWAVWNVDYRGVGEGKGGGGGWPQTYLDVAAAADLLVEVAAGNGLGSITEHDSRAVSGGGAATRVAVVGHSAGGALALWLAGRHRLADGVPGAGPRLRTCAVVAQAAVCDLVVAAQQRLGAGAVLDLLGGGPDVLPQAYAAASPTALLPLRVPTLVITGDADDAVPCEQSIAFAAAARAAGDAVRLEVLRGDGHFVHLDPTSAAWRRARQWLTQTVGR